MEFSNQIKKIRNEKGLTQEQFSKKLHVSRQTISNWEVGRNLPDLEMIVLIAKTFEVTLDQLIMGDDGMKNKLFEDANQVKKAKWNMISGSLFLIGSLCFIISIFTESTIRTDGTLYEPFFFLIPVGYLFLFIGFFLFLINFIIRKIKR